MPNVLIVQKKKNKKLQIVRIQINIKKIFTEDHRGQYNAIKKYTRNDENKYSLCQRVMARRDRSGFGRAIKPRGETATDRAKAIMETREKKRRTEWIVKKNRESRRALTELRGHLLTIMIYTTNVICFINIFISKNQKKSLIQGRGSVYY